MANRSTSARGYGAAHQRKRREWQKRIDDGERILCARGCGTVITSEMKWDLGHTDDRTDWTGPECVPCNRSAGGRNGAAVSNAQQAMTIRDW